MTVESIAEIVCTKCLLSKPVEDFPVSRVKKGGRHSHCKPCRNAQKKQHYQGNRERLLKTTSVSWHNGQRRDRYYQRTYGITLADYETMHAAQGGKCAICRRSPKGRRLVVDHCHLTGKVRKLLCTQCNVLIGWAENHALKYLGLTSP